MSRPSVIDFIAGLGLSAFIILALNSNAKAEPTLEQAEKELSAVDFANYKHCLYTSAFSAVIMEGMNKGESVQYLYQDMSKRSAGLPKPTRDTINIMVSFSNDLVSHSGEIVDPIEYAEWNYERCIGSLLPHLKEKLALNKEGK